jgi:hypothetical protein
MVVLGGLSAVQLHREALREREARQALMAQSLAPLASEIGQSTALDEISRRLSDYQHVFVTRGHPDHQVALFNEKGRAVAVSSPGCNGAPDTALTASVGLQVPALSNERFTLTAWEDGSGLAEEIARRRRLAWLDIGATILVLSLGVQLVVYLLVSRPLKQLLISIEKTENGYVQQVPKTGGAWEIRWIAWRFHKMSGELTEGARLLVAAQRRAMVLAAGKRDHSDIRPSTISSTIEPGEPTPAEIMLRRYLHDRCVFLEACQADDPSTHDDALEAWEYDVVEAERLGDMELKGRLENAALRLLDPEAFETVSDAVESLRERRSNWCIEIEETLSSALKEGGVQSLSVEHRVKHAAGVWRKMQEKHLELGEVHDTLAFRLVVPDRDDCYLALDAVHRLFEPEPFRFKDYIARPKANGYQSLHTTVRDQQGFLFEVQIRSMEMHKAAENGASAHWRYRAGKSKGRTSRSASHLIPLIRRIIQAVFPKRHASDALRTLFMRVTFRKPRIPD